MKWYEYKAEVDDLHASEELKARLLAMQTAQAPAPVAPARKKAVYFPLKRVLGIAACFGVGFLCCGAIGFSTLGIGMRAGSANSTAAVMSARNAVPQMASYQMDMENALPEIAADRALEPQARTGGQEAAQAGAKIIYTARLTLESKDYDDARAQLDQALATAGGYLESSEEYAGSGPEEQRCLSLTLRVPQENYESFLQAAAQTGNLVNQSQQAEDITTQYMDLEARLANLQAQRERLLQLQAQADTLADLLEIESSLNEVQYQLESWQSQMNWYEDQIQCCTVYLSLNEVQTYSPTAENFIQRLGAAFSEGWQGFVAGAQQLVVWLVMAWPVVLLAAVVLAVVLFLRRLRRKR